MSTTRGTGKAGGIGTGQSAARARKTAEVEPVEEGAFAADVARVAPKTPTFNGFRDPKIPYIPPPEFTLPNTGWDIDRLMPRFDVTDRERIQVEAPPGSILPALVQMELRRLWAQRLMLALRLAPELVGRAAHGPSGQRLADLRALGLVPLADRPANELCLGLVGRFWMQRGDLRRITPEQFRRFGDRRCSRVIWAFRIEPDPRDSRGHPWLVSELRGDCLSESARWSFFGYWTMIRPFAGSVMRQMLRAVKDEAEGRAHAVGTQLPM